MFVQIKLLTITTSDDYVYEGSCSASNEAISARILEIHHTISIYLRNKDFLIV